MEKNIGEARRLYLEQYGSVLVTNTYLKSILLLTSVALLGAFMLSFSMFTWAKKQKPLIIRINNETGMTTLINTETAAYAPEAPEVRYFLAQFVQLHFSRILGTVEERFGKSLFFLDAKLSQAVIEEERRSQSLAKFVREGTEEIDIDIKNIALQNLRSRPMKATVDFEKVFYLRGERKELRRERYAAYFEFVVQENVANALVLVNPLGLTFTYFRIDAAFK